MNIKNTLTEIVGYLSGNRQVGHTTAILEGAKNTDCLVLTHNQEYANSLQQQFKIKAMSIASAGIRGRRSAIVLDNAAVQLICSTALSLILKQERQIEKLNNKLGAIRDIAKRIDD